MLSIMILDIDLMFKGMLGIGIITTTGTMIIITKIVVIGTKEPKGFVVTITTMVIVVKVMAKDMEIITKVMVTIIKIMAKIKVGVIGVIKVGEIFKTMLKEVPHSDVYIPKT